MPRSLITNLVLLAALAITGCHSGSPAQAISLNRGKVAKSPLKPSDAYRIFGGSRVETALQLSEPTEGSTTVTYATEAQVMNAIETANAAVIQAASAESRATEAFQTALKNEESARDALTKAQEAKLAADSAVAKVNLAKAQADLAASVATTAEAKANTAVAQAALIEAKAQSALDKATLANNAATAATAAAALAEARAQNAATAAAAADVKAAAANAKAAAAEAKATLASTEAASAVTAAQSALDTALAASRLAEDAAAKIIAIETTLANLKSAGGVNVLDFGAKGDNITDDTAAIQAAIDFAESIKGGTSILHGAVVKFPPGQYRTKGGIHVKKGITIEGTSENGSVLRWDCAAATAANIAFCIGILGDRANNKQLMNAYVKDLSFGIFGNTSSATRKPFLSVDFAVEPTFRNIRTSGVNETSYVLTTGVSITDAINANISGFVNDGGWTGLELLKGASNMGVKVSRFDNIHIYGTRGSGLVMGFSDQNIFTNTLIETYSTQSAGQSGLYITNSDRNNFNGLTVTTSLNKYAYGVQIDGDSNGNAFSGITLNGTSGAGIVLGAASENNSIHGGTIGNCGGDGVTIQGNASNNTMSNLTSLSNGGDGFDVSSGTARNNTLIGCVSRSNGAVGFKSAIGSNSTCIAASAAGNVGGDTSGSWALFQQAGNFTGALNATTSIAVGGGTAITRIAVYTPTLTPNQVPANATGEQTFNVPGLAVSDTVTINPPAALGFGLIVTARVSAPDTLAIQFGNLTPNPITPTMGTYRVLALRN